MLVQSTKFPNDLTFQEFQHEFDSLPGKYTDSQGGALLIARLYKKRPCENFLDLHRILCPWLCCPARRRLDGWCEMERLYVAKVAREATLDERPVESIVSEAKAMGYCGICLDLLPEMKAAQNLYLKYGFVEIQPYYITPITGTVFMSRDL
jgi:GNAT superfamily N-acetyltransferase